MQASLSVRALCFMSALVVTFCSAQLLAETQSGGATNGPQATTDGQHAFDWDIGTWKTHQKRLLHPLLSVS